MSDPASTTVVSLLNELRDRLMIMHYMQKRKQAWVSVITILLDALSKGIKHEVEQNALYEIRTVAKKIMVYLKRICDVKSTIGEKIRFLLSCKMDFSRIDNGMKKLAELTNAIAVNRITNIEQQVTQLVDNIDKDNQWQDDMLILLSDLHSEVVKLNDQLALADMEDPRIGTALASLEGMKENSSRDAFDNMEQTCKPLMVSLTLEEFAHLEASDIAFDTQIGAGGFGKVFGGTYKNDQVAIKKVPIEEFDAGTYQDAQVELSIWKELEHQNIVKLFGLSHDSKDIWFVMDRCNVSLHDIIHKVVLEPRLRHDEIMRITRDIADGLSYLHAKNIVHRDVKPGNILIKGNNALLADFGVSEWRDTSQTYAKTDPSITTLRYTAPESLDKHIVSTKSDIFSLGIVIWEAVERKRPFRGKNVLVLNQHYLDGKRLDLDYEFWTDELMELVDQMWCFDFTKRPRAYTIADQLLETKDTELCRLNDISSEGSHETQISVQDLEDMEQISFDKANLVKVLNRAKTHRTDLNVHRTFSNIIFKFCEIPKKQDLVMRKAVGIIVYEFMVNFSDDLIIQKNYTGAFMHLAYKLESKGPLLRKKLENLLINAMEKFSNDRGIQKNCAGVLMHLAYKLENNGPLLTNLADLLFNAMENFSGDPGIQKNCTGVFMNLVRHSDVRNRCMQEEAGNLLIKAMRGFPKDKYVQKNCAGVFMNLAVDSANIELLVERKVDELLIEAMKEFSRDSLVQQRCAGAFSSLAVNFGTGKSLMKKEVGKLLIKAMEKFPEDGIVQQECAGALLNLAATSESRKTLMNKNVDDLLIKAMQKFPGNSLVQQRCAGAFWNLTSKSSDFVAKLKNKEVGDLLITAMKSFPNDNIVQRKCAGAIMNLAVNSTIRKSLMEKKVNDLLITAMETLPNDTIVQSYCAGALKRCGAGPKPFVKKARKLLSRK